MGSGLHDYGRKLLDFLHFWIYGGKDLQSLKDVLLPQMLLLA